MLRTTTVLTVFVLALALAACGDDADVDTGGSSTTSTSATSSTTSTIADTTTTTSGATPTTGSTVPASARQLLISVEEGGGFVPYGTDFAAVPNLVLGDGTTFAGAPVVAIYPGPAMNPVNTGTIPSNRRADLLRAAKDAHLDAAKLDVGQPGVADVPTTTIRVRLDGVVHEHAVYALGFEGPGLTAEQMATRAAIKGFVDAVRDASSTAANAAYKPTGFQLIALRYDPAQQGPDGVAPNHLDWPFADIALAGDPHCIALTGSRAKTFAALLPQATQITVWTHPADHAQYRLVVRATLPVSPAC
jgi:hypothetical protein